MKPASLATLLTVLTLGCTTIAEAGEPSGEWTSQQREVIDHIESCQNETVMEIWLACYHRDYFGWYKDTSTPFTFADKKALALTWDWAESGDVASEAQFVPLKPLSVTIFGNLAIVLSLDSLPANYLKEGDPPREERWTSVLVKEDGEWEMISEHADRIMSE
jgi:hypothetical protein